MEAPFPPLLSGLAQMLLRRPPSLRELVTIVGYADDYAWFAGLVRRLLPDEAEGDSLGPRRALQGGAFRTALRRAALPLVRPLLRVLPRRRGRTLMDLAAEGHPLRPDGLRLRRPPRDVGLPPRWHLGPGPTGQGLRRLLRRPGRAWRTAWLESAAGRIPKETLQRIPEGGIPVETLTEAVKDTRFEGAAQAAAWLLAETGNFFLDHSYDDGSFDGFADPWDDDIIAEGAAEWRRASALMDSVSSLTGWLEEDLPARFAQMLDFILPRLPVQEQGKEDDEHDK